MIALHTLPSSQSPSKHLVLIHAFPLTSSMYEEASAELQKADPDLAIHLVDLPGYGKSTYRERWTLAEAMQDLHDELHIKHIPAPVIGGTSMGGYAVFAYYRLFPQEISGLVLSNTKASADNDEAKKNREVFAKDIEKRGQDVIYEKMLDKMVTPTSRQQSPELVVRLRNWIAASEPRAHAAAQRAMGIREDATDLFEKIELPTLIVAGSDDMIIPLEESKKMQKIRNSHLAIIPETAHLSVVEAPSIWANEVAGFLQTLEGSPL